MDIKRVKIVFNPLKSGAPAAALRLLNALQDNGFSATADPTEGEAFDSIAVVGGDGTILGILDEALDAGVPILSVNLGRVGFLSEIEPDEIEADIQKLKRKEYFLEKKILLEARAPGGTPVRALNDIVFSRAPHSARTITVEIRCEGSVVDRFSGDGVIVSSPTGSTAYSFSAGGPVVEPGMDLIIVTPICAHTLHSRPFILSPDSALSIRALNGAPAQLVADGRKKIDLEGDCRVEIIKSNRFAQFIRVNRRNFYERFREKLAEWND
jgi:NAD+ kinase